ncbi:MAG TPA: type I secretion protein TolC [Methylophaga sp.]|jgi:outer membrane protein|uniref:TolC family outer membrane protein n=2 Tax=Methylophaga TaxID=40222 RepID=UPI000C983E60|nr:MULTISPECIES: TolC family outer membrane protein [unclassified Methylophaga]MAP26468.1 type I secretion protein TolC [Methylophaga sp.]HAD32424.1 type I secretion protein TolC [Methylophaga sp.]HBX60383.1 type I secretion protein TolC [Methylophaga sp.]HCO00566.1 type I secretion protein TolC [Methylophaga sp.]|tara:strand:+ start:4030 stop:5346 length:1317 start_codon:yes stop_codon:yes gene_type:complete
MKTLFIAVFFAAVFSRPAWAVQDLVDIYNLSVQSDPILMAQAASLLATSELEDQADAAFLPQVDMVANNSKVWTDSSSQRFGGSSEYNDHGYTLSLVQPIYRRNNFVQSRQATIAIEGATADYQFVEQDLIVRVAERYFAVLGAEDDLSFALAELEAIEKQLEQAEQRFEVGLATIIDVTEARAAYDLATAAVIEAENLLANAREALRETAGQYPSELAELKEETPLVKPEPENIDEWSEQAIVMNPVLLSANSNVGLAKENIEFERSGHYPTLDLVAQKGYTSQSDSNLSGSNKTHQKILGLQINIPIYAGGVVNSRTREASFRLDEAMQNEEEQRRAIIRQTRAAYNSVMSGVSRVNALQQAVYSNKKALESTEAGFDVGTRTTVDVLNARRELFSALRDYSRSRYEYVVNTLRLKQAAGIVSVNDIEQINQWLVP